MPMRILRLLNRLLSLVTGVALAVAVIYAGYALWDNRQIAAAAENPLGNMAPDAGIMEERNAGAPAGEIKAEAEPQQNDQQNEQQGEQQGEQEEETELSKLFKRLKAVNPDIGAWITMPGTAIDYAVVRGENNIEYVSKDIYGNFAIVGSIFLDSRNAEDYTDTYNLLYGHNMSEHRMFSDVNLYKDETFFNENQKGYFYVPTGAHWLQSLSIIVTSSADSWILNPVSWKDLDRERMLELIQTNALFVSEAGMEALQAKFEAGEAPQIVALSTCSNEFTDARTILLTLLDP